MHLCQKNRLLDHSAMERYLLELSANKNTDYSLWKSIKYLKRPIKHVPPIRNENGGWIRSNLEKANAFAKHLEATYTPHEAHQPTISEQYEQHLLINQENTLHDNNIPAVTLREVVAEIKLLKLKKAPGYDLITAEVLQELPQKGMVKLTHLFNAAMRIKYVPSLWKVAEIIMIPKPGKDASKVASYRPISLLPLISKLFEKLMLKRIKTVIEKNNLIPSHQFGFCEKHSTIDQVHRVTETIESAIEKNQVCSAIFLDVAQAFDKVWHAGLLFKIKAIFPEHLFHILESYLSHRYFRIKQEDSISDLRQIKAGVPQGAFLAQFFFCCLIMICHNTTMLQLHLLTTRQYSSQPTSQRNQQRYFKMLLTA